MGRTVARVEVQVRYLHIPYPIRKTKECLPPCSNLSCQNHYVPVETLDSSQTCQQSLLLLTHRSTPELEAAAGLACLPYCPSASVNGRRHARAWGAPAPEGNCDPTASQQDLQATTHRPPASSCPKASNFSWTHHRDIWCHPMCCWERDPLGK